MRGTYSCLDYLILGLKLKCGIDTLVGIIYGVKVSQCDVLISSVKMRGTYTCLYYLILGLKLKCGVDTLIWIIVGVNVIAWDALAWIISELKYSMGYTCLDYVWS